MREYILTKAQVEAVGGQNLIALMAALAKGDDSGEAASGG